MAERKGIDRAATADATIDEPADAGAPRVITTPDGDKLQLSRDAGVSPIYSPAHHELNREPEGGWPAEIAKNMGSTPASAPRTLTDANAAGVQGSGATTATPTAGTTGTTGTTGTAGSSAR